MICIPETLPRNWRTAKGCVSQLQCLCPFLKLVIVSSSDEIISDTGQNYGNSHVWSYPAQLLFPREHKRKESSIKLYLGRCYSPCSYRTISEHYLSSEKSRKRKFTKSTNDLSNHVIQSQLQFSADYNSRFLDASEGNQMNFGELFPHV